jgi:hypothetical protein
MPEAVVWLKLAWMTCVLQIINISRQVRRTGPEGFQTAKWQLPVRKTLRVCVVTN